mmetsp:Transcript_14139/g.30655  ORF Transcript_14139/g.30655 Transcript_14139/m.30655 type:complete len:210 (-) Transcript_14139:2354-2983(-)
MVPTSILCALSSTYSRLLWLVTLRWLPPGLSGMWVTPTSSSLAQLNGEAAVATPEGPAPAPMLAAVGVVVFDSSPAAIDDGPDCWLAATELAAPGPSKGLAALALDRLEWWKLQENISKMSPSMSMSKMDIRDLNSVWSSSCRSIKFRGMPRSSFQNGSQKFRLRVIGPSSLPLAADSTIALAMNMPMNWNFFRCEGELDSGLMYSWFF